MPSKGELEIGDAHICSRRPLFQGILFRPLGITELAESLKQPDDISAETWAERAANLVDNQTKSDLEVHPGDILCVGGFKPFSRS